MGIFRPNIDKLEAQKNIKGLMRATSHFDMFIRRDAIEALGRMQDSRIIKKLIRHLGKGEPESSIQYKAQVTLVKMGGPAVQPLINALNKRDYMLRENAAEALGQIGDKRAVEPLIHALKDKKNMVRSNAAEALGQIGDKRAVDPLIHALRDKNYNAAGALGQIGDKRAVDPLIHALKDKNYMVQDHAAAALGHLKDKRAVDPLIHTLLVCALKDEKVYSSAAWSLGEIGDVRATKPLLQIVFGDQDNRFQLAAARALTHAKLIEGKQWRNDYYDTQTGCGYPYKNEKVEIIAGTIEKSSRTVRVHDPKYPYDMEIYYIKVNNKEWQYSENDSIYKELNEGDKVIIYYSDRIHMIQRIDQIIEK